MSEPQRIQLKRTKGWKMPPNTVKVDRTTKWGNPFVVEEPDALTKMLGGRWYVWTCGLDAGEFIERCVSANITEEYHSYGWDRGSATDIAIRKFKTLAAPFLPVAELRGKNLACWCKPGAPCHADVLLELANEDLSPAVPSRAANVGRAA